MSDCNQLQRELTFVLNPRNVIIVIYFWKCEAMRPRSKVRLSSKDGGGVTGVRDNIIIPE